MMCMRCPGTKTIPQVEFQQRQQSKKYVGLNATARARKQLRFEDSCLSISHHKDVRVAIATSRIILQARDVHMYRFFLDDECRGLLILGQRVNPLTAQEQCMTVERVTNHVYGR